MRKVTLVIAKLGLKIDDVIRIQLVDSLGQTIVSMHEFNINEEFTLDSETLTVDLLENNKIFTNSFYKLILPNKIEFTFSIFSSDSTMPHDLIPLLKMSCFKRLVHKNGNEIILANEFVKKLELYFMGEKPYFSNTQRDLVNLYEYYADEVIDTSSTIDVVRLMDEYLGKLGVN